MSDVNAYKIYVSSLLQIMEFKKLDERKTCVEMFVHVKSINSRGCTDGTISSKRCVQYSGEIL